MTVRILCLQNYNYTILTTFVILFYYFWRQYAIIGYELYYSKEIVPKINSNVSDNVMIVNEIRNFTSTDRQILIRTNNAKNITVIFLTAIYNKIDDKLIAIFIGDRDIEHKINCISNTDRGISYEYSGLVTNAVIAPSPICQWTQYLLSCKLPQLRQLAVVHQDDEQSLIPLPFQNIKPASESVQVVACISPVYLFERWKLLVLSIEVLHRFGTGKIRLYIQSMLEFIFKLLRIYQANDIVDLVAWPDVPKLPNIDPNAELEWRNQVGAYTECLHLYKVAAKFIIFMDPDDLLIPRGHNSYLEEFAKFNDMFPNSAAFLYNRHEVTIRTNMTSGDPKQFSVKEALRTAIYKGCVRSLGTKYVAIPSRLEGAWIHWPGVKKDNFYKNRRIPCFMGSFAHFRSWTNETSIKRGKWVPNIVKDNLDEIQTRYEQMLREAHLESFPQTHSEVYMPIIDDCFVSQSKNQWQFCSSPTQCPKANSTRPCVVARALYDYNLRLQSSVIIVRTFNEFLLNSNGCL